MAEAGKVNLIEIASLVNKLELELQPKLNLVAAPEGP